RVLFRSLARTRAWMGRSSETQHRLPRRAQSQDPVRHDVAGLQPDGRFKPHTDGRRCAGVDQVARLQDQELADAEGPGGLLHHVTLLSLLAWASDGLARAFASSASDLAKRPARGLNPGPH